MNVAASASTTVCLGCGCACDDIAIVVRDARIVEARNACPLGVAWFGDGVVPARMRVAGRDASSEEALDAAARLLADAARPLVYLAPDISCEAQREAVALADTLHATLDSVTSATAMDAVLAAQEQGRAGATLGEVRNRADVIVFWGVDPALRYPRFSARYGPEPQGLSVTEGRRSRHVVAVDVGDARGPADADLRVAVSEADETSTLTALAAVVGRHGSAVNKGVGLDSPPATSTPWIRARKLAPALLAARYAVVVADSEAGQDSVARDPGRASALVGLAQALNGPTRCALSMLRGGGNRSGADAVMTWQTGYPAAVDFARGAPRYRPYETAGARLARGEIDAVLVVGSAALVPLDLVSMMARVPCAVVGPRASESALADKSVVIDTGVAGIHEGGTALRMDDVPLPLRPSVVGSPGAGACVRALRDRVVRRRSRPSGG